MEGGRAARAELPRLHVVTDDRILRRADVLEAAARIVRTGGRGLALHVRGPRTDGARLYEIASALVAVAGEAGALLLVNDRADVALVARAHGVHLGGRSLPVAEARRILGPGPWVGASAHEPGEAALAAHEGADFAFVGTIWESESHPGRTGGGRPLLRAAVLAAPMLPLLAIGGVTEERAGQARAAGAHGVAVIRGVWEAGDPAAAVKRYLEVLDRTTAEETVTDLGARHA